MNLSLSSLPSGSVTPNSFTSSSWALAALVKSSGGLAALKLVEVCYDY